MTELPAFGTVNEFDGRTGST